MYIDSLITSTFLLVLLASAKNMSEREETMYQNISHSCNNFSSVFYKALSTTEGNLVSSPLSLHVILSLLSQAANGITLSELKDSLYIDDLKSLHKEFKSLVAALHDTKDVELHCASTIFTQKDLPLEDDFLSVSTEIFHCPLSHVNFDDPANAADQINKWVKDATHSKILEIISADKLSSETKVVLANAIYFRGQWLHQFDEKLTTKRLFHLTQTDNKRVPTMFKKSKFTHGELKDLQAHFIEIPYMNEDIVMVVMLPYEIDGLQFLEKNFDWNKFVNASRLFSDVELYLPRFTFEFTVDLKDVLKKIGLNTMFEDNANFDGLSKVPLKVGNVLQKVYIKVNEEGSEAAATTVAQMRLRRMAHMPEEFDVNRPFMFAIQHKPSNMPLFLGSVRNIDTSHARDEL